MVQNILPQRAGFGIFGDIGLISYSGDVNNWSGLLKLLKQVEPGEVFRTDQDIALFQSWQHGIEAAITAAATQNAFDREDLDYLLGSTNGDRS